MSPEHGNMGPQLMFGDFCVVVLEKKRFWLMTVISKMVFALFFTPITSMKGCSVFLSPRSKHTQIL